MFSKQDKVKQKVSSPLKFYTISYKSMKVMKACKINHMFNKQLKSTTSLNLNHNNPTSTVVLNFLNGKIDVWYMRSTLQV